MTDTVTSPALNVTALPPELFRHWIHSREEDQDDVQFFRPPDFAFPPSFGRDGMEVRPDGQFVQHDIGPADGTVEVPGRWTQESATRIAVRFDGAREDYDFTVESVDAGLLRIRVDTTASTGSGWVPARRNRIRAFRRDRYVLVVAEGDLPTPGYDVDIKQSPERIFPPRFDLLQRQRPGFSPQVVTPFRHSELILFPADQPAVTVDHADGRDEVEIEACGQELAGFAAVVPVGDDGGGVNEAIGMSADLRFDEAFAKAIENLPPSAPTHPDALTSVTVDDIRGLFGGIAGFHHLVVRVRSSTD